MRLRYLRLKKNLTQGDVGNAVGITQFTYSNYENNKTEPDLETLKKLADFFEVSLDYLCERQYNNNIGYIPDDKKELVSEILELDDSLTNEVYQYVKYRKSQK